MARLVARCQNASPKFGLYAHMSDLLFKFGVLNNDDAGLLLMSLTGFLYDSSLNRNIALSVSDAPNFTGSYLTSVVLAINRSQQHPDIVKPFALLLYETIKSYISMVCDPEIYDRGYGIIKQYMDSIFSHYYRYPNGNEFANYVMSLCDQDNIMVFHGF